MGCIVENKNVNGVWLCHSHFRFPLFVSKFEDLHPHLHLTLIFSKKACKISFGSSKEVKLLKGNL